MALGSRRRAAAGLALLLGVATLLLALYVVIQQFPRGLIVLACVAAALAAGWYGLLRRGVLRLVSLGVALVALAVPVMLLLTDGDHLAEAILIGVGLTASLALARAAFRRRVSLPAAPRPDRPVLFSTRSLAGVRRSDSRSPIKLGPGASSRSS